MIQRIGGETNPNWIGAIAQIAQEIEEADLAIKLGFFSSPIVFSHRWQPDFERVDFLIWNDPFGAGGGEMILRLLQVIKGTTGKEVRIPIERDQTENRARLLPILRAWERAIEGLEEPNVYPVMPPLVAPDVDHRLWIDPFWRALHALVSVMGMSPQDQLARYYAQTAAQAMRKINRLAGEAGLPSRVVFLLKGASLLVHRPDGGPAEAMDPSPLTELSEATGENRARVIALLRTWQERRAAALLPLHADQPVRSEIHAEAEMSVGTELPAPKAKDDGVAWTSVKDLTLNLEPVPGRRRPDLVLRIPRGAGTKSLEVRICGTTAPNLARVVIEQPDQDHSWRDLLIEGQGRGLWRAATPAALERTGRRIKKALPPSLSGHWQQSSASVRWVTT